MREEKIDVRAESEGKVEISPMATRFESCPHCGKRLRIEVHEDRSVSIKEAENEVE